jgi:hypothetical protein
MTERRADDVRQGDSVNGHGSHPDEVAIKTIKLTSRQATGGRSGLWRLRVLVASAVALVGAAVLVPVAASAAVPIALVQESSNATVGSNSLTLTLSNSVQAGDALVASFNNTHDGLTVTTISGGGVSWKLANIETDNTVTADSEIWYGLDATGGPATVTVDLSGTTDGVFYALNVSEWSGVGGLDQAPPGILDHVGSTPALAPAITPSTSGDLFIGVIGCSDPAIVSGPPGGGFSAFPVATNIYHTSYGYLVATDASTHQYSQPLSEAGIWSGTAAAFYPQTGSSQQGAYASDSFERTVSGGWGTADTGGSWALQKGAAADESVNGSSGVFAIPADVFTNSEQVLDLPDTSALDYQGSFDITWMENVNTLGAAYGGVLGGLVARFQNAGATGYYRMSAVWDGATGHIWLRIQNACGGLSTCNNFELDTDTGIDATQDFPGGPYGPYHVKVEIVGSDPTSFAMKIWKAGTAEPANWMLTTTDTNNFGPQVAGPVGFRGSDDLEYLSGNYLTDYTSHVEINNLFVGPVPAPAVDALSPTDGPIGGGTSVTVTGANFFGATAVDFGGRAASSFTVNGDDSITAVAPPDTAGPVDVTVTTPGGTSTTNPADEFTYEAAPTVTGVDPTAGPLAGGTSVTVTGTNFTGATVVDFRSTSASFTVVDDTTITTTSPPDTAGTIDVTVVTPGGTSTTNPADEFTYEAAPTVTAPGAPPASAPGAPTGLTATAGDTTVTLTWTAPSSNGGSVITGYNVYEGTTSGAEGAKAINASLVGGTSYTVTGLANGTKCFFTVEAVNSVGNSAPSNEASATPVAGVPVQRIYGTDAIGTSIAISEAELPVSGSAKAVVLARSDFFSDALAGGPLAAKVGGPLLITAGASSSSSLDSRVQTEIQRVLPVGDTVYILGGPLALSTDIDGALQGLGYVTERVAGANEYATAVDVAEQLGNPSAIFEATGLNFPDALSAVPAAIAKGGAILLTDGSSQAPETASYLAAHPGDTRYAIGGPLTAYGADPTATPVYGQDLYGTSAAVASTFFAKPTVFGAATGTNFPDALSGGAFMGARATAGPVLLVQPSGPLPPSIASYMSGATSTLIQGYLFGGPVAVGTDVLSELESTG